MTSALTLPLATPLDLEHDPERLQETLAKIKSSHLSRIYEKQQRKNYDRKVRLMMLNS